MRTLLNTVVVVLFLFLLTATVDRDSYALLAYVLLFLITGSLAMVRLPLHVLPLPQLAWVRRLPRTRWVAPHLTPVMAVLLALATTVPLLALGAGVSAAR